MRRRARGRARRGRSRRGRGRGTRRRGRRRRRSDDGSKRRGRASARRVARCARARARGEAGGHPDIARQRGGQRRGTAHLRERVRLQPGPTRQRLDFGRRAETGKMWRGFRASGGGGDPTRDACVEAGCASETDEVDRKTRSREPPAFRNTRARPFRAPSSAAPRGDVNPHLMRRKNTVETLPCWTSNSAIAAAAPKRRWKRIRLKSHTRMRPVEICRAFRCRRTVISRFKRPGSKRSHRFKTRGNMRCQNS